MHTKRFNILVGPEECFFQVPEGLLIMHSPVFKRMCSAPFIESNQRRINLPEEDSSLFEDFFEWMHSSRPRASLRNGTKAIFDLAIFAEKYQICDLANQISDLVREEDRAERLNPGILDRVYSSVPKGAVLRQLCSWILKWEADSFGTCLNTAEDWGQEYEQVFTSDADLGRDFFKWSSPGGKGRITACTFHDHSNIPNYVKSEDQVCPYTDIFGTKRSIASAAEESPASKKQKMKH